MTSSDDRDAVELGAADLATFEQDFEGAPVEDSDFEPVPDGKYRVSVERVELVRSRAGNAMLKWTLRILGPEHEGRLMWRHNLIRSPENLKWLKTDLHTCGMTLAKLTDLPARLGELLDVQLEVTKRTRDGSENVYLNKRLASPEGQSAPGGSALPPF